MSDTGHEKPARGEAEERDTTLSMRVVLWLVVGGFFVFYMLLAGVLVRAELIVVQCCPRSPRAFAELVRVQDARQFRPRLRWMLRAWRIPRAAVTDCRVVLGALWRRVVRGEEVSGGFRAFNFPVAGTGGRAAGRRALLNAALSFSPNTYVVGIDEEREQVLVHELVTSPENSFVRKRSAGCECVADRCSSLSSQLFSLRIRVFEGRHPH